MCALSYCTMKKKLLMLILLSLVMVIILGCTTQIPEKPGIEEKQIKETKPAVQPKEEIVQITGDYDCAGDVICSEGALYCSENGKLRLLEDCRIGCSNGICTEEAPIIREENKTSTNETPVITNGTSKCIEGSIICQTNALWCSKLEEPKQGTSMLLEDCRFGCNEGEKRCKSIYDNPITGACVE